MSILTYDISIAHTVPVAGAAPRRNSLWRGVMNAMIASRMRQAEREIARRSYLLPRELDRTEWKVSRRSEDSLPLVR